MTDSKAANVTADLPVSHTTNDGRYLELARAAGVTRAVGSHGGFYDDGRSCRPGRATPTGRPKTACSTYLYRALLKLRGGLPDLAPAELA